MGGGPRRLGSGSRIGARGAAVSVLKQALLGFVERCQQLLTKGMARGIDLCQQLLTLADNSGRTRKRVLVLQKVNCEEWKRWVAVQKKHCQDLWQRLTKTPTFWGELLANDGNC